MRPEKQGRANELACDSGGHLTHRDIVDLGTWANDARMTQGIREWLGSASSITRGELVHAITRKVDVSLRVADVLIRIEEDAWDCADLHPLTDLTSTKGAK